MTSQLDIPTVTLLDYKGKSLRVNPVGLADLMEIGRYLRDLKMEDTKRQIVGLPLPLAKELWSDAKKVSEKIQVGTSDFREAQLTLEGLAYTLYVAIRSDLKEFTLPEALAVFDSDYDKALDAVLRAAGYGGLNPTKGLTTPPT